MTDIIIFYFFASIAIFAALGVLMHPNPVLSVLHLIASMLGVSGLFFMLGAQFIAAVQIMVYAGAVFVLFLMVMMIFNLKSDGKSDFSPGTVANGFKVLFAGMFSGLLLSSILFKMSSFGYVAHDGEAPQFEVRNLSKILFTDYVFSFELLGLLLLVIPIGTVALSRIHGGTHND